MLDTSPRPLFNATPAKARQGSWIPVLAVAATAFVGGLATRDAPAFYAALDKPGWAPPAAVFGPVWTVLYLLMAVAAVIVWRRSTGTVRRTALGIFFAQLVANAAWSWLFFGARLGAVALAELVVLWLLVAATVVAFWRVRPWAGAMVAPTLAWVSFAGALNASTWLRNPGLLGMG
jgi:tryptophan-rich sensory protein